MFQIKKRPKLSKRDKSRIKDNRRIIKSWRKLRKSRKNRFKIVPNLSDSDYINIKKLLFMGIVLRVKRKSLTKYKVWVKGSPHIFTLGSTCSSAYRRIFRLLKSKGIYF